jgi:hypothetical protein
VVGIALWNWAFPGQGRSWRVQCKGGPVMRVALGVRWSEVRCGEWSGREIRASGFAKIWSWAQWDTILSIRHLSQPFSTAFSFQFPSLRIPKHKNSLIPDRACISLDPLSLAWPGLAWPRPQTLCHRAMKCDDHTTANRYQRRDKHKHKYKNRCKQKQK